MKRTFLFMNIISVCLTIVNFSLGMSFKTKMKSLFNNTENDDYLQYDYLSNVLCEPYFILIKVIVTFDLGYFMIYFFLKFILCNTSSGNVHNDNVLTKSIRENKMTNLLVEFLFLFFIKGISLGFGFFYAIEAVIETKRIIEDVSNAQSDKQLEILNEILTTTLYIKWFDLITMIYTLWMYVVRIGKGIWKNKEKRKRKDRVGDVQEKQLLIKRNESEHVNLDESEEKIDGNNSIEGAIN